MTMFEKGFFFGLHKLAFDAALSAKIAREYVPRAATPVAAGVIPERAALDAATQAAAHSGGKVPAAVSGVKGGKGLGHYLGSAGKWIGKNPKAALGIGAAGLLGAGLLGRATKSNEARQ